jgi:hypothetical protein
VIHSAAANDPSAGIARPGCAPGRRAEKKGIGPGRPDLDVFITTLQSAEFNARHCHAAAIGRARIAAIDPIKVNYESRQSVSQGGGFGREGA